MIRRILSLGLLLTTLATFAHADDFRTTVLKLNNVRPPSGGGFTDFSLDASNDALETVWQAPEAVTFTKLCYRYGARTGTPPTYKISVQGVDSSSRADGTIKTGTGECSASFTPPANTSIDGTWVCQTVTGTTCALAAGEVFAIVIKYASGTINGSNFSSFTYTNNVSYTQDEINSYGRRVFTVDAGSATSPQYIPVMGWGNASRYFGYFLSDYSQSTFSSDSTPDEYANRFQIDGPSGCTYTLLGAEVHFGSMFNCGKTLDVVLYDGTTALEATTFDTDTYRECDSGSGRAVTFLFDDAPSDLSFGLPYYLSVKPNSTSMNMFIRSMTVASNDYLDSEPLGKNTYLATRTDAGAWTATNTKRLAIYPIIHAAACSGGSGGVTGSNKLNSGLN